MAIFGTKRAKEVIPAKDKAVKADKVIHPTKAVKVTAAKKNARIVVPTVHSDVALGNASVIISPRITEKSGILSQSGVYTFQVSKNANKATVAKAITALYKIVPLRVSIINTPTRNVFVKGRKGTVSGIKKAIITVKKGDKIDFV